MLSTQEQNVKTFMETVFIPALHKLLSDANPVAYKEWGGNACRQTAVYGYLLLTEMLPEYKWTAWDGVFTDVVYGKPVQYNHAWLHGVNKVNGKRLLVDMSRLHHERLFIEVNSNKYPNTHPSYENMVEVSREKLDIQDCLQSPEYYTGLYFREFMEKLQTTMRGVLS